MSQFREKSTTDRQKQGRTEIAETIGLFHKAGVQNMIRLIISQFEKPRRLDRIIEDNIFSLFLTFPEKTNNPIFQINTHFQTCYQPNYSISTIFWSHDFCNNRNPLKKRQYGFLCLDVRLLRYQPLKIKKITILTVESRHFCGFQRSISRQSLKFLFLTYKGFDPPTPKSAIFVKKAAYVHPIYS